MYSLSGSSMSKEIPWWGKKWDPGMVTFAWLRLRILDPKWPEASRLPEAVPMTWRDQPPLPRGSHHDLPEEMLHSWPLFFSLSVPIIPCCLLGNSQSQVWSQLSAPRKTIYVSEDIQELSNVHQQRCVGVGLEGVRLSWSPGAGL